MEHSIQEMVKKPLSSIPNHFLVHHEPAPPPSIISQKTLIDSVPVLDLASLLDPGTKASHLETLRSVCKNWGIFQLVNHGVDTWQLEKLKREIFEFYRLPLEERLRYKRRDGDVEGYGQTVILSEGQKVDWADRFYMITNPVNIRKPHLFPCLPPSLRETLEEYISMQQKLARTLFGLIAETLGIKAKEMLDIFEDGMQSMRMNYYPPCPEPDKVIGLTPHSDACGITILHQVNGIEGLQVKKDGTWIPVKIVQNAFIVNLGDVVEIMSNGLYKSVEHRATVNSEHGRISVAVFFNPKFGAPVGPLPGVLAGREPVFRSVKSEEYTADFFKRKLDGKTYLQHMKI